MKYGLMWVAIVGLTIIKIPFSIIGFIVEFIETMISRCIFNLVKKNGKEDDKRMYREIAVYNANNYEKSRDYHLGVMVELFKE